jgi:acetolactate synthase-1/2/3 large subunit
VSATDFSTGVKMLEVFDAFGVDALFSSPGSEWPVLWEAIDHRAASHPGFAAYSCRHEELAVTLAIGYNRVSHKTPALILHGTLGLLKAAMALRYALHSNVPMVILTGESAFFGEVANLRVGEHWQRSQSDIGGPPALARPLVKRSERVSSPEVLLGMLYDACRLANTAPRGPVLLSIPQEYLRMPTPSATYPSGSVWETQSNPGDLGDVASMLVEADHPVIVTQTAGAHEDDVQRLVRLAETAAISVYEGNSPGYVNFPTDHDLYQGFASRPALENADVLLAIGCRLPWYPASARPASLRRVVVIDEFPAYDLMPYWGLPVDRVLGGSLSATLNGLSGTIGELLGRAGGDARRKIESRRGTQAARHRDRQQDLDAQVEASRGSWPVDSRWLAAEIAAAAPADAILLDETTVDRANIAEFSRRSRPGTFFSRTSGGLGLVMGIAQGVKLAAPDRTVIEVLGDGGFHYSPALAAFGFAQDYPAAVLTVIADNASYASMAEGHLKYFPGADRRRLGITSNAILPPSYADVARAFGAWGRRVESPEELRPLLAEAIERVSGGQSALLDVPTRVPDK